MQYGQQPMPPQNIWYGNNYSGGYSQANRSAVTPTPMSPVPQQPMVQTVNNVLRVMGPESAREYQVGPNSSVILMDSNRPVFYMKRSDDSGYSEVKAYEFHEIPLMPESIPAQAQTFAPAVEYVTREEFDELKKMLEELTSHA